MKYTVKTKNNLLGSTFTGELFRDAVIEYENGDEDTETYSITSERDLERVFDIAVDVITYTVTV